MGNQTNKSDTSKYLLDIELNTYTDSKYDGQQTLSDIIPEEEKHERLDYEESQSLDSISIKESKLDLYLLAHTSSINTIKLTNDNKFIISGSGDFCSSDENSIRV